MVDSKLEEARARTDDDELCDASDKLSDDNHHVFYEKSSRGFAFWVCKYVCDVW